MQVTYWALKLTPFISQHTILLNNISVANGHIMLNTPVLVQSQKLSDIEPSQYWETWVLLASHTPPWCVGSSRLFGELCNYRFDSSGKGGTGASPGTHSYPWNKQTNKHFCQSISGHSTTTWTEFCHFWPPPPEWTVLSFYTLIVDKNRHFLIPPSSCPRSYWMAP